MGFWKKIFGTREQEADKPQHHEEVIDNVEFATRFVAAAVETAPVSEGVALLRKKVRCLSCNSIVDPVTAHQANGSFVCPQCGQWWLRPKTSGQQPAGERSPSARMVIQVLSIPRREVEGNPQSIDCLLGAVDLVAETAVREGRVHLLDVTFDGYGADPRELYEIAEVCHWVRRAFEQTPGIWYFLTTDCQRRFIGWLCGPFSRAEVNTASFQARYDQQRMDTVVKGVVSGEELLHMHGANKHLIDAYRKYHLEQQAG